MTVAAGSRANGIEIAARGSVSVAGVRGRKGRKGMWSMILLGVRGGQQVRLGA